MLYTVPRLGSHKAYRVNRNVTYFISKLRTVNNHSNFNPLTDYFDSEFAHFLGLTNQVTLKEHFRVFFNSFKVLNTADKDLTIRMFTQAQRILNLLNDVDIDAANIKLNALPATIRTPARNLFNYLFDYTLKSFGKLRDHYKLIFDSLGTNICPFCGIEYLNSPSILIQDYDHMLKISDYVLSGVNMDNLIPTGVECNRINKHAIDVLYDQGVRKVFNSAYLNHYDIRISLDGSTPPNNLSGVGTWNITITPDNDYTREWARVYNIRARYIDNILNKFYLGWLREQREYFFISNKLPTTSQVLQDEFSASGLVMKENPTLSLQNIVKGAVYEFIASNQDEVYQKSILHFFNSRL